MKLNLIFWTGLLCLLLLLVMPFVLPPGGAQARSESIKSQVASIQDGKVWMTFAARPGVRGHGSSIQICSDLDSEDWEEDFITGPVRLLLSIDDGEIYRAKTYIGGKWKKATGTVLDLGSVATADAVEYLLDLAKRAKGGVGEDVVFAASLADSVEIWPELLELAKDSSLPDDTREACLFWLGQAAGEKVCAGLAGFIGDDDESVDIREQAVFALSQCPDKECIPVLVRVARTNSHPDVRKSALFWLAQKEDPLVLSLFEEILLE